MTGFRPTRSAMTPQKMEEKPLPTMYDAAAVHGMGDGSQYIVSCFDHVQIAEQCSVRREAYTKKTSIESDVFLCFSDAEVPYLCQKKTIIDRRSITTDEHELDSTMLHF